MNTVREALAGDKPACGGCAAAILELDKHP